MGKYGLKVKQLVVNNVIKADGSAFLAQKAKQQHTYLEAVYDRYSDLSIVEMPMFPGEVKGMSRLEEVAGILFEDGRR
jgi:arsenite-transporting ATPase